jgi:hypothetical protein
MRAIRSDYFEATTFSRTIGDKKIDYWIKGISEVLQHMVTKASTFSDLEDVEGIDMSLGGEQNIDWS